MFWNAWLTTAKRAAVAFWNCELKKSLWQKPKKRTFLLHLSVIVMKIILVFKMSRKWHLCFAPRSKTRQLDRVVSHVSATSRQNGRHARLVWKNNLTNQPMSDEMRWHFKSTASSQWESVFRAVVSQVGATIKCAVELWTAKCDWVPILSSPLLSLYPSGLPVPVGPNRRMVWTLNLNCSSLSLSLHCHWTIILILEPTSVKWAAGDKMELFDCCS